MKFTLNIETGNAAMLSAEAVAEVLTQIASEIRDGYTGGGIADPWNGMTVGSYTLDLPEEDEDGEDD